MNITKKHIFTFLIGAPLKDRMDKESLRSGLSLSEMLRRSIELYLEEREFRDRRRNRRENEAAKTGGNGK
jgi:Ribbon-helix-helix protein, copG family